MVEFFSKEKLTLVYKPAAQGDSGKTELFSFLLLCVDDRQSSNTLEEIIEDSVIDFGRDVKNKLKKTITDTLSQEIEQIDDGYSVRVSLKDTSLYAYAPRRFARAERAPGADWSSDRSPKIFCVESLSPASLRIAPA